MAPEAESVLYGDLEFFGDLVVFAGIGLGHHVAEKLSVLPPSVRCIVLDFYPECIENARRTLFADKPNSVFFASPATLADNRNDLTRFIESCGPAIIQIIRHPASYDINCEFYAPLLDEITKQKSAGRRSGYERNGRVLLFHGSFFLEEEMRRALSGLGPEPVLFPYNNYPNGTAYETALSRAIQDKHPDLILSVNMKGVDGEGILARVASGFSIPFAVWFVDDPRPILLSRKNHIPKGTAAFSWEKAYLPFLKSSGFSAVHYLPLAGDPFMAEEAKPGAAASRLGFVGSSMVDRYAGNIRGKFLWHDSLSPLVDAMSDRLTADPRYDVFSSLPQAAREVGVALPFSDERNLTWLTAFIIHFASMKKRKGVVEALLPNGVETYGDPEGWKELFGNRLATHGDVDYRHDIFSLYKSIDVNINSTSCQMPFAVNQRVFDIPLAGGFVLSDHQADLFELFDKSEVATYGSTAELQERASFFLEHEAARTAIVQKARSRIVARHTYSHRLEHVLASLR